MATAAKMKKKKHGGGRPRTSLEGHFLFFPHSDYDIRRRTREEYQEKEKREWKDRGWEREREKKKSHIPAATGLFPYKAQQPVSSSGPIESMLQVFNKKKGNRNEVIKQIPTRNVAFRWR